MAPVASQGARRRSSGADRRRPGARLCQGRGPGRRRRSRCCSTRPSTSCASAWTRSMSAPATAASCSTAELGPDRGNGAAALPPALSVLPNASTREISLCLYIRSNDVGLGTPFNLTEGAALLHLVGRLTGYTPRWFTYFIGDAHIYENHLPMLREQLSRTPFEAPAWCCRTASPTSPPPAATSRNGWSGSSRAISRCRLYAPRAAHGADGGVEVPELRAPSGRRRGPAKPVPRGPSEEPCRIDGCRHGAGSWPGVRMARGRARRRASASGEAGPHRGREVKIGESPFSV